jgi:hypothetical protein
MSQDTALPAVEWADHGLRLSRLAFGCAPVMGRVGRRAAMNAMAMAFDAGVTHFDVARSYGFGDAERIVGAFLRTRHGQTTITTKFGVLPQQISPVRRLLIPALRTARRLLPSIGGALRRQSAAALHAGRYALADAKRSLDASLKTLRRDSVDLLLIHDCSMESPVDDDVIDFMMRLKDNGTIRAWGFATSGRHADHYLARYAPMSPIIQREFSTARAPAPKCSIVHSLISNLGRFHVSNGGGLNSLLLRWADAHGIPQFELQGAMPRLMMETAFRAHPESVVLCSMFDRVHIDENISCLISPKFAKQAIDDFCAVIGHIDSSLGLNGATLK